MIAHHCNADGCDTWRRADAYTSCRMLAVQDGDDQLHFCGWDCPLRYGAHAEPEKVIEDA